MTELNDLYLLKMFSTAVAHPDEFLNVFWFKLLSWGTTPPGSNMALRLGNTFGLDISNNVAACLEITTTIQRIEVVNYGDPTDFSTVIGGGGLPRSGDRVGAVCPANLTLSFRYERANPGLRSGWKRFGLLSEIDVAGDAISASLKTAVDILTPLLGAVLTHTGGSTYAPVVAVGLKLLGVNPAYYDPPSVAYAGLGSQNSRKPPLLPNVF